MIRQPPRSPLSPYTTLFRSQKAGAPIAEDARITLTTQKYASRAGLKLEGALADFAIDPAGCEIGESPFQPEAGAARRLFGGERSEEHPSVLQSPKHLLLRLL